MAQVRAALTALVFTLILATGARAEDYPAYEDLYINDFAGVLEPDRAERLREKLRDLREAHGVEMTLLTIDTRDDFTPTDSIETFATRLFNGWGIGDASRNDGVLVLVAVTDRQMRIELGSGYDRSWDDQARQVIDNIMIPNFKQGEMPRGIEAGIGTLIARITTNIANGKAATDNPVTYAVNGGPPPEEEGGFFSWLLALIGVPVAGGGAWGVRTWMRNRPRHCESCQTRMTRLDETADDAHLDDGSKMEEMLKSVDYDVYECPQCRHIHIERWAAWFSAYGACPSCSYKALESDSTVLRSATYSSSGLKRIDYNCKHCHHAYSETRTIPRKERSSSGSSSSSSFGGGSSSGGGASGSW